MTKNCVFVCVPDQEDIGDSLEGNGDQELRAESEHDRCDGDAGLTESNEARCADDGSQGK